MRECPEGDRLAEAFARGAPAHANPELLAHVQACPECQTQLRRMHWLAHALAARWPLQNLPEDAQHTEDLDLAAFADHGHQAPSADTTSAHLSICPECLRALGLVLRRAADAGDILGADRGPERGRRPSRRRWRRRLLVLVPLGLLLLSMGVVLFRGRTQGSAASSHAAGLARPVPIRPARVLPERILFSCRVPERTHTWALWTIGVDGSDQVQLTDGSTMDHGAAWSPDGRRIAFGRADGDTGLGMELWVMNADGTEPHPISPGGPISGAHPCWSPDGSQVAFTSPGALVGPEVAPSGERPYQHIAVIDLRTDMVRDVTDRNDQHPSWSPGGEYLLFDRVEKSDAGDLRDVWTVRADGSDLRWVTRGHYPKWSPDGMRCAFVRDDRLYVRETDGTDTRLEPGTGPSWSPEGRTIAFVTKPDGGELRLIDVATNQVRTLAEGVEADGPAWSP